MLIYVWSGKRVGGWVKILRRVRGWGGGCCMNNRLVNEATTRMWMIVQRRKEHPQVGQRSKVDLTCSNHSDPLQILLFLQFFFYFFIFIITIIISSSSSLPKPQFCFVFVFFHLFPSSFVSESEKATASSSWPRELHKILIAAFPLQYIKKKTFWQTTIAIRRCFHQTAWSTLLVILIKSPPTIFRRFIFALICIRLFAVKTDSYICFTWLFVVVVVFQISFLLHSIILLDLHWMRSGRVTPIRHDQQSVRQKKV